jgi:hypothetical protein
MKEKKPIRAKPPRAVEREIARFYGDPEGKLSCVVTGEDIEYSIHHLDDNPANSSSFYNLLPISSELNSNIEYSFSHDLAPELKSDNLRLKSSEHYARGKYSHAYGCCVLGASLAFPWEYGWSRNLRVDPDAVIEFSANALLNLRPINEIAYASHVLSTYVVPIVRKHMLCVEMPNVARLAVEIGSYYRDAGNNVEGQIFVDIARNLLLRTGVSGRVRSLLTRMSVHEAINRLIINDNIGAKESLISAETKVDSLYSMGDANIKLYKAQLNLREDKPDFDMINEILGQVNTRNRVGISTTWTDAEILLTKAQAQFQRYQGKIEFQTQEYITKALDKFTRCKILPTRAFFPQVLGSFSADSSANEMIVRKMIRSITPEFNNISERIKLWLIDFVRRSRVL